MSYALFIDDERLPPEDGRAWEIARNLEEVVELVRRRGPPVFISFDHDLGDGTPTGLEIAQALVTTDLDTREGKQTLHLPFSFSPDFEFDVHSQNPVGAENIRRYLESYLSFIREKETP